MNVTPLVRVGHQLAAERAARADHPSNQTPDDTLFDLALSVLIAEGRKSHKLGVRLAAERADAHRRGGAA